MKKSLSAVITLLLITIVFASVPTDAEAMIYDDTLRLHILANSDSQEDQDLKLKIRDHILEKYSDNLKNVTDINEAQEKIETLLSSIEEDAEKKIYELGYNYSVQCTLVKEWYETREYESFSLPAGYYTALKIVIGSGEGKNWWCVMYPPLCLSLATEIAPKDDGILNYTKEETYLISSEGYSIKFKSLEIISRLFSKK